MKKIFNMISILALLLSSGSVFAQEIQMVVLGNHAICYERRDLMKFREFMVDEDATGAMNLLDRGKCFINKKDKKYTISNFDPKDSVQAIIMPSRKWARVFTFSIDK